jgi:hypothetical protein
MAATSILLERQSSTPFSCSANRGHLKKRGPKRRDEFAVGTTNSVPASYREMDDSCLVTLGGMGNLDAREEILKRHIMHTDHVSYASACDIFCEIEEKNHEWMRSMALPFQVGIVTAFSAGFISVPMVFHLPTVEYFNEHFVTADHPPLKELETALEVGR